MRQTPIEQRISKIVEPVVQDLGFALVWVKIIGESGMQTVQILAENSATKRLTLDDCTTLSKAISATLDVEDPISGRYRLEVSSPGIDRPLLSVEDFKTYIGFEARLETETPLPTGQKRFKGPITGVEGDTITMVTDQGEAKIPFSAMTKARLVLTDSLIKATALPSDETSEENTDSTHNPKQQTH